MKRIIKEQCASLNISHFNTLLMTGFIALVTYFWADLKKNIDKVPEHTTELAIHEVRLSALEVKCVGKDEAALQILKAYKDLNMHNNKNKIQ